MHFLNQSESPISYKTKKIESPNTVKAKPKFSIHVKQHHHVEYIKTENEKGKKVNESVQEINQIDSNRNNGVGINLFSLDLYTLAGTLILIV